MLTLYRLVAAPFLVFLLLCKELDIFKWLLPLSFFTDLIDGFLARKYKVTSVSGARVDSVADDLTVLAAILGIVLYRPDFLLSELSIVSIIIVFYIIQNGLALVRYRKLTSFHTYTAKTAALFQGLFLVLFYFLPEPQLELFYVVAALTIADLAEEILLVLVLSEWEADVKGLYWAMKKRQGLPKR